MTVSAPRNPLSDLLEADSHLRKVVEELAKLQHEQWMVQAKAIMETEELSEDRVKRWKSHMKEYKYLPEEQKETDRKLARQVVLKLLGW